MGVDVPNQSVCRHLYGLSLNHHLLHAARVVHLVPTDAELARPEEIVRMSAMNPGSAVTLKQMILKVIRWIQFEFDRT